MLAVVVAVEVVAAAAAEELVAVVVVAVVWAVVGLERLSSKGQWRGKGVCRQRV